MQIRKFSTTFTHTFFYERCHSLGILRFAEVVSLDAWELLHFDCAVDDSDYIIKLFAATLVRQHVLCVQLCLVKPAESCSSTYIICHLPPFSFRWASASSSSVLESSIASFLVRNVFLKARQSNGSLLCSISRSRRRQSSSAARLHARATMQGPDSTSS